MIANIPFKKFNKVARKTLKPTRSKIRPGLLPTTRNSSHQTLQKSRILEVAGIGGVAGMIYAKEPYVYDEKNYKEKEFARLKMSDEVLFDKKTY